MPQTSTNSTKNQTSNSETFLQKLLGENYKWWFIIRFSLISEMGGKMGFLTGYFATILRIISSNYVWFLAKADSATFTYLIIGNIYQQITSNVYYYRLSSSIYSGSLTSQLMSPLDFFAVQYCKMIGVRFTKNFINLGGVLIGVLFCILTFATINLPSLSIFFVLLTIPIAFTINQFLGAIIGSFAFWIKAQYDYEGVRTSYESLFLVLTGLAIPLDKMPFNLGFYFSFLPTSWLLHHPMQIYLGKYDSNQTGFAFLGGIFWAIFLYFLAKFVFKMGLKKNESVGL